MQDSPPRFFYFDLGNVLLSFDHHRAARQMAEVAGTTPEKVWEVVFASNLEWRFETGEIDSFEFYQIFSQATGTRSNIEDLHQAAADIFELNVPLVPIVAALNSAGHRLGILSNTNEAHWSFVANGRYTILARYFEQFVLSFEVNSMKPARKIYRAAAERANASPHEIFFVDDRPENVAGACEFGIDAVLFTTAAQLARQLRDRGVQFNY